MGFFYASSSTLLVTFLSLSASAQPPNQRPKSQPQVISRPPGPQSRKPKVYVAPFTARGGISPELLTSFTDEFETAFIYAGCYEVLERRDLDQLLKQIRNERGLTTIRDLGVSAAQVQGAGATAVIFGVINDDVNSGEVVISAKMEYFDSRIGWKNEVPLPRGRREDRTTRLEAIKRLIGYICADKGPESGGGAGQLTEASGLQFGLQSCSAVPSRVLCKFTVTSPGRDRKIQYFGIINGYSQPPSELYDQGGNAWKHTNVTLGSAVSGLFIQEYLLVRNVPVQATMTFPVSTDVESIPLIKIFFSLEGKQGEVEFRNITPTRR